MKRLISFVLAALVLGAPLAGAMDSKTLLADPVRYRVIYGKDGTVAYADMETVKPLFLRNRPESAHNVAFTMYVEVYKPYPTAEDLAEGHLVEAIAQCRAVITLSPKFDHYKMERELVALYDEDGRPLSFGWGIDMANVEGKDVYNNFVRIPRNKEK